MKHLPLCFCLLFTFTASYAVEEETQIDTGAHEKVEEGEEGHQSGRESGKQRDHR